MISIIPKPVYSVDELDLVRSVCRDSFYDFVQEFWDVLIAERPVWNWHVKYLCDELQVMAERVFIGQEREHHLIVNIPPGTTKSTIISIMFPAWVLLRMPSARTMVATHTEKLGLDLSRKSRMVVQSPQYQELFPQVSLVDDQNTKGLWATTKGGFRLSCTVGGQNPMGFHAHFLIVDDPIDPQKVYSEAELLTAQNFMNETLPSRRIQKSVSVIILVMQRLHQSDPTGAWLRKSPEEVRHICLPASTEYPIEPSELAVHYKDGLLDPIRLDKKTLDREKLRGAFFYSGQYGQDPVPLGGGMFKTGRLHLDTPPARAQWATEFSRLVRYWDKAATEGGGAFSVGVLMGFNRKGHLWILDVVRGQWDSDEREEMILATAKLDGKRPIVGFEEEGGSGGKQSVEQSMRMLAGWRCRADRPTGDKALRADPFSTQVNARNVYVPKEAPWLQEYIDEMKFFPASTYKDQIDASSGAFKLLANAPRKARVF